MWKKISFAFSLLPARRKVVRRMIELGLCITEERKILCGDVEVKDSSLAKSCGVDRRVVASTIDGLVKDRHLFGIFSRIQPAGTLLTEVAQMVGFGVIEIEADAKNAGIIAKATALIANAGISIRQIYAKDPDLFENPSLTIITEREVPGAMISKIRKIRGVRRVIIH